MQLGTSGLAYDGNSNNRLLRKGFPEVNILLKTIGLLAMSAGEPGSIKPSDSDIGTTLGRRLPRQGGSRLKETSNMAPFW